MSTPQKTDSQLGPDESLLKVHDLSLVTLNNDSGGRHYAGRPSFEERQNQLYPRLASELKPHVVVDIGANYGFTASIFAKNFPDAKLILVEPDPKLAPYIKRNLAANGVSNYDFHEAICCAQEQQKTVFSINPTSSQDNRVKGLNEKWQSVEVPGVTLSNLLKTYWRKPVFIKIDTQGFETEVFQGGENYLMNNHAWFVKTEFAPDWIRSQGQSALELLRYLVERYNVIETPARTRFNRDSLPELFAKPLHRKELERFLEHVVSLNDKTSGWVDLYLCSKKAASCLRPSIWQRWAARS